MKDKQTPPDDPKRPSKAADKPPEPPIICRLCGGSMERMTDDRTMVQCSKCDFIQEFV